MKNYSELHVESGFSFMDQENGDGVQGEIWNQFDLNGSSILYGDFPTVPDFPCMSSSSSSSSTSAPVKPLSKSSSSSSASSSSAASWAALKSDMQQENRHGGEYESVDVSTAALLSTASMDNPNSTHDQDCLDVMEDFGFIDLLEGTDLLDSSSMFQSDDMSLIDEYQAVQQEKPQCEQITRQQQQVNQGGAMNIAIQGANVSQEPGESTEELAVMFFEWLKNNRDRISAEDLRRVKIKKSTIESAARRLGGGKEAMKQLLKLVLEWVQINHLERRQRRDASAYSIDHATHQNPNPNPLPNSNPSYPILLDPYTQYQYWMPTPQPYVAADQVTGLVGGGYMCPNPNSLGVVNGGTYMPQPENYNSLEAALTWPPRYSPFVDGNFNPGSVQGQVFTGYGNNSPYQYLPGQGDELVRLGSSATKEARKKRMARQRRNSSLHRNHGTQNQNFEQQAMLEDEACVPTNQGNGGGNWVYWSSGVGSSSRPYTGAIHSVDVAPLHQMIDRPMMQPQSFQRQGWKPEKNLRFLLQKVLKQSDVGNLGRIVLPKKEAEMHMPELDARDGISITMEDIGTSRVWNMRYRFWPNNKSRMYLLENTGDFVRANGLQEGDFIVIYSDVKSSKYLIRGVKVRQPGLRSELKKPSKSQRTMHANSPAAAATASTHGHCVNSNVLSTPSMHKLGNQ